MAEISGVFLGFVGLMGVVMSGQASRSAWVNVFRLVTIAICCAVLILGALVPMTLQHLIPGETSLWRVSAAVLYASNLVSTYVTIRLTPGAAEAHQTRRAQAFLVWCLEPVLHFCLLACLSPWLPDYTLALYFSALMVLFVQIVSMFVFFLVDFSVPEEAKAIE